MTDLGEPAVPPEGPSEYEKLWDFSFKNPELILVTWVGSKKYSKANRKTDFPEIIEVKDKDSNREFTYIDCSGVKFYTENESDKWKKFSSLILLSQYLTKAPLVKILVFVDHEDLLQDSQGFRNAVKSCPFVRLVTQNSNSSISIGLVAVKLTNGEGKGSETENARTLRDQFEEAVKELIHKLSSDLPELDTQPEPGEDLKCYENFLKKVVANRKLFLLPQQRKRWNGSIRGLVSLPSPPGFKLFKFCANNSWFRSFVLNPPELWALWKHQDSNNVLQEVAVEAYKFLGKKINTMLVDELKLIMINIKKKSREKAKEEDQLLIWTETIKSCLAVAIHHENKDYLETLLNFASLTEFRIESKTLIDLWRDKEQFLLLVEMCQVLDIELANWKKKLSDKFQFFLNRIEKEIVPDVQNKLERQMSQICKQLEHNYKEIVAYLCGEMESLVVERLRLKRSWSGAIEILTKASSNLNTRETAQLEIYEEISVLVNLLHLESLPCVDPVSNYVPFQAETVKLEETYEKLRNALFKSEGLSCVVQSLEAINGPLVSQLEKYLETFRALNSIINDFHPEVQQILTRCEAKLSGDRENLSKNVKTTRSLRKELSDRTNLALLPFLELLTKTFSNKPLEPGVVWKLKLFDKHIELLHGTEMPPVVKQAASGFDSFIKEELASWETCIKAIFLLESRLEEYEYQILFASNIDKNTRSHVLPQRLIQSCLDKMLVHWSGEDKRTARRLATSNPWSTLVTDIVSGKLSVQSSTENDCLSVRGRIFHTSRIKNIHQGRLTGIKIFASEKVILDCDLSSRPNAMDIVIATRKFEVAGYRKVIIAGEGGDSKTFTVRERNLYMAETSRNGPPGLPGGNGGNFYLICDEQVGLERVVVECQGGDGGSGHNGIYGEAGSAGRNAGPNDVSENRPYHEGFPGTPGKNGGDGGKGGAPGNPGNVKVCVLSGWKDDLKIIGGPGKKGRDGRGASGGVGGISGLGCTLRSGWFGIKKYDMDSEPSIPRAANGQRGHDGGNTAGQILPSPKAPINEDQILKELRNFLATKELTDPEVTEFLEKLNSSHVDSSSSTPLIFTQQLLTLESASKSLPKSYKLLQSRVNSYVSRHSRVSDSDAIVLKTLNAFLISKSLLFEGSPRGAQVVNLSGYFEVINETLSKLETSRGHLLREDALNDYQSHISKKVKDLQSYIAKIATPAIESAQHEINLELAKAVHEMEEYREVLETERRQRLIDAEIRKKIQRYQGILKLLSCISLVANIGGLFGFWGIASVVGAVVCGIKQKALEYMPNPPPERGPPELPECIQASSKGFWNTMKADEEEALRQIQIMAGFMKNCDHSGILEDLRPLCYMWVRAFKSFQDELNNPGNAHFREATQAGSLYAEFDNVKEKIMERLWHWAENPELPIEIKSQLKQIYMNLLIRSSSRQEPQENITDLAIFSGDPLDMDEYQITHAQNSVHSQIGQLVNFVIETSKTPGAQLSSHCDKWNIKVTLEQLRDKIVEAVKGLKAEKRLYESLETLKDSFNLLIDIYEDISQHEEKSKLATMFYQMSTNNLEIIEDPTLQRDLNELQYKLKRNLFQMEFNEASRAFQQWLFPFGKKFQNEYPLESLEGDVLTAHFVRKFEDLRTNLNRYRNLVLDVDQVVFTGEFTSASKTSPPFYVWKWNEWKDELSRLLDGDQVVFKADVLSAAKLDGGLRSAVKFKSIKLSLRLKHGQSSEQKKLNKILKERYSVIMTHSGISHFRVLHNVFVMRGCQQEFSYSYDNKTRNVAMGKSETGGDYLLSPYTTWTFKLRDLTRNGENPLEEFKGKVQLQLEGDGWYVDEQMALDKRLDKTYFEDLHECYEIVDI